MSSSTGSAGMNIVRIEIDVLIQDMANMRTHSDANINAIKASLARWGQQKPIVIDSGMVVRCGNGTLEAARRLGWTHIDCVVSSLSGSELSAFAIADNRTAELAGWSEELGSVLSGLKAELPDLDLPALALEALCQPVLGVGEPPQPGAGADGGTQDEAGGPFGVQYGQVWRLAEGHGFAFLCAEWPKHGLEVESGDVAGEKILFAVSREALVQVLEAWRRATGITPQRLS